MTIMHVRSALLLLVVAIGIGTAPQLIGAALVAKREPVLSSSESAHQLIANGNHRDALAVFRKAFANPTYDQTQFPNDLPAAIGCLQQLGQVSEFDTMLESVVTAHPKSWRALAAVASAYSGCTNPDGAIVAGEFRRAARGSFDGTGRYAYAGQRDRVRALQLFLKALPLIPADEPDIAAKSDVYHHFQEAIRQPARTSQGWWNNHQTQSFLLGKLTDVSILPDYAEQSPAYQAASGAPVGEDGTPVFYPLPKSFEAATNDGERWRFVLAEQGKLTPSAKDHTDAIRAEFLWHEFGVASAAETLGGYWGRRPQPAGEAGPAATALEVQTLTEEETICRLATGVKRITLPAEYNPIKAFQQIMQGPPTIMSQSAAGKLSDEFSNRRQYVKAAATLRRQIEILKIIPSPTPGAFKNDIQIVSDKLQQIIGNWCRIEWAHSTVAGTEPLVNLAFRNAQQARITAKAIHVEKLLNDAKSLLKSSPKELDYNKMQLEQIGYRLIHENQAQYVGETVADFEETLKPRPEHLDTYTSVALPVKAAGAYLVEVSVAQGNTSRIVLWVTDTALVRMPLQKQVLYYVADAATGEPIAGANLEFFGWTGDYSKQPVRFTTKNFAQETNAEGLATLDETRQPSEYQWLAIARTKTGRLAYHGFQHVWFADARREEYDQQKTLWISDRPVYRPEQTVKFKGWVQQAKYTAPLTAVYAGKTFPVEIRTPQNEKVFRQDLVLDEFGGFSGEVVLPPKAALGNYQVSIDYRFNESSPIGSFRVEEYKKPEFEVVVEAPSKPVQLGEKMTAKVTAKYYFGAPVDGGKLKYKVLRTSRSETWYPAGPWDWLYGRGSWWYGSEATWHPTWAKWGCMRPGPWWYVRPSPPPEVITDQEVTLNADGTFDVEIDTQMALALHGNEDHEYTISAEVTDASRRMISGEGKTVVTREPFQVRLWLDHGYLEVGQTGTLHATARTLSGDPVIGTGALALLRLTVGADGKLVETKVQEWTLPTGDDGTATQKFAATTPGQYRFTHTVTTAEGKNVVGAYLFWVGGKGEDGRAFRFNDLELTVDKATYAPGESLQLLVQTNQADANVLLFLRPVNGVYLPPQRLKLVGKTATVTVPINAGDYPNFFIDAYTVSQGKLHYATREVLVPPAPRILDLQVEATSIEYLPGQEATLRLKLTDGAGKPFVGQTVVTVYDKALEYISGGSNVPEIRAFFWKWRYQHSGSAISNLAREEGPVAKEGEVAMQTMGVFGSQRDDLLEDVVMFGDQLGGRAFRRSFVGRQMFAKGVATRGAEALSMAAAPMATDSFALGMAEPGGLGGGGGAAATPATPAVVIRTQFADSAYWAASVITTADGLATVKFKLPENITGWKVKTWAMGPGVKVGEATTEFTTRKRLFVRLQSPRFFVEKDEVMLSGNIHNELATAQDIRASLDLPGEFLECLSPREQAVSIPPHQQVRVDWRVKVKQEGRAVVRMQVLGTEESDAVEQTFPVFVHGMLKTDSYTGVIRPNQNSSTVTVRIPAERRPEQSQLQLRVSPTLALAMVDALPYMVHYPYGCTEQTLNRFLPTVVTQELLRKSGTNLEALQAERTNLNSQQLDDPATAAARRPKRPGDEPNPVFDTDKVKEMVRDGVDRLTDMQLSDGGWGWFSGFGEHSSPHTTCVVLHGLQLAEANGAAVVPGIIPRGQSWLVEYQDRQLKLLDRGDEVTKNAELAKTNIPYKLQADETDAFVAVVLLESGLPVTEATKRMVGRLYSDRTKLAVYANVLVALACDQLKLPAELAMLLQNLDQRWHEDNENQTGWLKLGGANRWWYWHGNELEANSWYLKLLARTDPKGERASRLVKYLLNNRRNGTYWNSTRDTALCVEAFAEFITASGELAPHFTVEAWLDGQLKKSMTVTPETLFTFDNQLNLAGADLTSGEHTLELRRVASDGKPLGPIYYSAYVTNFTLEDHIAAAGLEIKVDRKLWRLKPADGTADVAGSRGQFISQAIQKFDRLPLSEGDELQSGDLVEVELIVDTKNDYEYLLFEDMKGAGFEPLEVRSGYNGNALGAYVEFRDERVAFFVQNLNRGQHAVTYRLRAEIPGRFSLLPTIGSAMYAPELKANSSELKLSIVDK